MAVSQSHFRFGVNELAESTHGWYAPEDTSPAPGGIALNTTFLLRFTIQCDAGSSLSNIVGEFQYRKNGGGWTQITTATTNVKAVTPSCWADGANTTHRLSGTGTFEASSAGCTADGTSGGPAFDIVANGNGETECALQLVGADLARGDLIEFRLVHDSGTLFDSYAGTPALQLVGTVPRTRIVQGPFPFPKSTPDFLPSAPSPDVTLGLTGFALAATAGFVAVSLSLGLTPADPLAPSQGAMTGFVAAEPVVDRPRIVTGPFPFPKERPAFAISSPDKTVALIGVDLTVSAGFMTPPPAVIDRPAYVQGPAPFLTSSQFWFREKARALIIDTTNAAAGPLSTATLTVGQGSLSVALSASLGGQSVTVGQGSLAASGDATAALSGLQATISGGTLTTEKTQAVTGLALTVSQGAMAASVPGSASLAGFLMTVGKGTLTADLPDILIHGRGSVERRMHGHGSSESTITGKGSR